MATHLVYTVFDDSAARSRSDCLPGSVFAKLDLAGFRTSGGSLRWKIQPSEYVSFYANRMLPKLLCLPIKYSLKPNLILKIDEELSGIPRLIAGPNGIKAGEDLSWTVLNLGSFPLDAQGYPDLSTHVHEQNEKLREECKIGATVFDKTEVEDSSCSSRRLSVSSFSTYAETEYCFEHDEEAGGVSIGYIKRGPVDYLESEGSEEDDNE